MTYQSAVIAEGPTSYWRLGETSGTTAVDSMSIQDGTYQAGVALGGGGPLFGVSDAAAAFDGSSAAYVNVPSNGSHNTAGPLTVEAWINTTMESPGYIFGAHGGGPSYAGYGFAIGGEVGAGRLNWWDGSNTVSVGGPLVNDGNWHHVVAVAIGTGVNFYVDGALAAGSPYAIVAPTTSYSGVRGIGVDPADDLGNALSGAMAEVAMYNFALSPARILAHYNLGTTGGEGTPPPTFEEYPVSRGSG